MALTSHLSSSGCPPASLAASLLTCLLTCLRTCLRTCLLTCLLTCLPASPPPRSQVVSPVGADRAAYLRPGTRPGTGDGRPGSPLRVVRHEPKGNTLPRREKGMLPKGISRKPFGPGMGGFFAS